MYQEGFRSSHCLVFTSYQAFLQSKSEIYCEDCAWIGRQRIDFPTIWNALCHMCGYPVWCAPCEFRQYVDAVEAFSRREPETLRWRRIHFGHSPESRKHFGSSLRMGSFGDCPLANSMRPCCGGQSGLRKGREKDYIQQSSANVRYDFSSQLGYGSSGVVE
jgi:hypothetical protein